MNETCEYYSELINLSLDGCATEEQTAALEKHILNCNECYERLIDYQIMTKCIEELRTNPPKDLHSNIMEAIEEADENNELVQSPPAHRSFVRYMPYIAAVVAIVLIFFEKSGLKLMTEDVSLPESTGQINMSLSISDIEEGYLPNYSESKMLYDSKDEQSVMAADGIPSENDTAKKIITADEIAEIYILKYPDVKFKSMIVARFEDRQQLNNALNLSMFKNLQIDEISEYGITCTVVKNNNGTVKNIVYGLPDAGASAEILSDSKYGWYDKNSDYVAIVMFAE